MKLIVWILAIAWIFLRLILLLCKNFFHLIFPCANIFLYFAPPPPRKFPNGPSLMQISIDWKHICCNENSTKTVYHISSFNPLKEEDVDCFDAKETINCYLGNRAWASVLKTQTIRNIWRERGGVKIFYCMNFYSNPSYLQENCFLGYTTFFPGIAACRIF